MPPDRPISQQMTWLLLGLGTLFLVVWNMPPLQVLQGVPIMTLPVHMLAEIFSVIVSAMVFGIAWNAYSQDRTGNIVIIGCLLLAVGLIDLVHMLSFPGMPDLITPSSADKAINFWLSARLLFALGMLVVALRPWVPLASPRTRYLLLTASLVVPALVTWLGLFHPDIWPRTFIQGQGLTAFKIGAEYAIIAILLVSAVRFYLLVKQPRAYEAPGLFAAMVVTILSELSFTFYSDVADIFNLLGHLYKIVAYILIYQAVFVTCVRDPFQRLDAELAQNRRISEDLARHKDSLVSEIDERKQVEREILSYSERLSRSNRELKEFTSVSAHDLQEPLRKVEIFADKIVTNSAADLSEKSLDDLERLVRSVQHMRALIADLLSYAHASARRRNLESVDLETLAGEVVIDLQHQIEETGGSVHIGHLPVIDADPIQMSQLLRNLIENGLKFHQPNVPPRVTVEGHVVDDERTGGPRICRFTVRDIGIGFDEMYTDQIFSMFQRLHGVSEYPGTGIGLALCRRIAEHHSGEITATSTPGEGSTFTVSLPVTHDPEPDTAFVTEGTNRSN